MSLFRNSYFEFNMQFLIFRKTRLIIILTINSCFKLLHDISNDFQHLALMQFQCGRIGLHVLFFFKFEPNDIT